MRNRPFLLVMLTALFLGESYYFLGQCRAGFERLMGEHAFYANDLASAWRHYQRALDHGGPRALLEQDLLEVLVFGLDQREIGLSTNFSFDDESAVVHIRRLNAGALRRYPHRASHWSTASDVFLRQSRQSRREKPLDLSALSDEPLENLTQEDWWGIAALEKAASLERVNYIYDDLMAEQFLAWGAVEEAARACRRAVAAYPRLDGHTYLMRVEVPEPLLEGAVAGFEEALRRDSLIAGALVEIDAGRLLVRQHQERRALPFLERAVSAAPDLYDSRMELALALFRLKRFQDAIPHFTRAAEILPEYPTPHYYLGMAHLEIGESEAAIQSLRKARVLGKGEPRFFHALATAVESAGKLDEAERQFTAAAYQNPEDAAAWSTLLAFHLRHGNRTEAIRVCDRLLALDPDDEQYKEQCAAIGRRGA